MSTPLKKHFCFDIEYPEFLKDMERIADNFNYDAFMAAVMFKNYNAEKLRGLLDEAKIRREMVKREYYALFVYKDVFINSFLTNDNELFNCSQQILRKVNSTFVGLRNIMNEYTPSAPSAKFRSGNRDTEVDIKEWSYISSSTYQTYMYSKDNNEESILDELYNVYDEFFMEVKKTAILCQATIDKVNEVKNNPAYCLYLYEEYREKWLKDHASAKYMTLRPDALNHPILKVLNKHGEVNKFCAQELYHSFRKPDGDLLMYKLIQDETKFSGMDVIEISIFDTDRNRAAEARMVIEHWDNIDQKKGNKLDAKLIAVFMDMCLKGCKNRNENIFVENYFYKYYRGNKQRVNYQSINRQKNLLNKTEKQKEKRFYEDKIKEYIESRGQYSGFAVNIGQNNNIFS